MFQPLGHPTSPCDACLGTYVCGSYPTSVPAYLIMYAHVTIDLSRMHDSVRLCTYGIVSPSPLRRGSQPQTRRVMYRPLTPWFLTTDPKGGVPRHRSGHETDPPGPRHDPDPTSVRPMPTGSWPSMLECPRRVLHHGHTRRHAGSSP